MKSYISRSCRVLTALALVAVFTNCNSAYENFHLGKELRRSQRELKQLSYEKVLRFWTRKTRVYDKLNTILFMSATFHTPQFRRGFAKAFPDIYGKGGQITKRELLNLGAGVEGYLNFFISMYTPNPADNDLEQEDSIWGLTLESDKGVVVTPVEKVRIKIDSNIRAVYQYIGNFDRAYIIRFPMSDKQGNAVISDDTASLTLKIASAQQKGKLVWGSVD